MSAQKKTRDEHDKADAIRVLGWLYTTIGGTRGTFTENGVEVNGVQPGCNGRLLLHTSCGPFLLSIERVR